MEEQKRILEEWEEKILDEINNKEKNEEIKDEKTKE
jgi:hypothetical protein